MGDPSFSNILPQSVLFSFCFEMKALHFFLFYTLLADGPGVARGKKK